MAGSTIASRFGRPPIPPVITRRPRSRSRAKSSATRSCTASRRSRSSRTSRSDRSARRAFHAGRLWSAEWNAPGAFNVHAPLVDTNDDRMQQVMFANGKLWSTVTTVVKTQNGPTRTAAAWFALTPGWNGIDLKGTYHRWRLCRCQRSERHVSIDRGEQGWQRGHRFQHRRPGLFPGTGYAKVSLATGATEVKLTSLGCSRTMASPDIRCSTIAADAGATTRRRSPMLTATSGLPTKRFPVRSFRSRQRLLPQLVRQLGDARREDHSVTRPTIRPRGMRDSDRLTFARRGVAARTDGFVRLVECRVQISAQKVQSFAHP